MIIWPGVVVIIWYLDLQLPVQSVPITTNIVSLNYVRIQDTEQRQTK
jgi:hypothetical protein